MPVAPLIKPIQTQKGMFYTFQSSLEDLSLTFNNNSNKFRFSKFALLRIPEIGVPTTLATDNRIQFLAAGESPILNGLSSNQNINLAQSFENYALNFESLIISQAEYMRDKKLNVSERVFWKWLKELGAVRWREATNTEVAPLGAGELRWAEDWADPNSTTYNRVVKYIGDIDVINSVRSNDNSYSELYIHVPTNAGTTPTVLFKSIADENYHPDMLIINSPDDPKDAEYLNGRHYTDTHPYPGMDLLALYDLDSDLATQKLSDITNTVIDWGTVTNPYNSISNTTGVGYWWGANQLTNTYHTDQADYFGAISGIGTSPTSAIKTQKIYREYEALDVEFLRSTFDGAVIDFTLSDYLIASQDPTIKSLAQLNDSVGNYDFEFNAVLVYYEVYDPTNNTDIASNLYGIYFLNKIESNGIDFVIPMITKEKPDAINKTNGNAFAFKINLKFDTSIEDVAVEKSINDYTTFGLDLFLDVLTELRNLQTTYNDKIAELINLSFEVDQIKNALTNTTALDALAAQVAQLETTVSASTAAFNESTAIMDLINSLNVRLDDLYNNRTSINLSYNLEPFRKSYGISLDKTVPGYMTIGLDGYTYSNVSQIDLSSPSVNSANIVTLSLGYSNSYFKHYKPISNVNLNPATWTLTSNQEIRLNDSLIPWKVGKTLRLVIDSRIDPSTYSINIKTDASNASNSSAPYGITIASLTQADFPINYGRIGCPIVEITCVDPVNFTFQVDKIIR
jgi:hypothetical protein